MLLTKENYHSQPAKEKYMGASQFKSFLKCESEALAEIKSEYQMEESTALLQGQYFDSFFDGGRDLFEAKNKVYKKTGDPYSEYLTVMNAYERVERDPEWMRLATGEQQVIMTGVIQGVEFKIMIDSLLPDMIVDRKLMRDFEDKWDGVQKLPWWAMWGYHFQAAIYSEIYEQNTGKRLPFVLAAVTKEKEPDIKVTRFTDETIEESLQEIRARIERYEAIKRGQLSPTRCEQCGYCKSTKIIVKGEYELL